MRILFLVGVFFLVVSCSEKQQASVEPTYFDLKSFFKKEAESLKLTGMHIRKKIITGNDLEQKEFTNINWEKELRPFSESDINKPAWKLSYLVDTFYLQSQVNVVYKSKEAKLPIKKLEVILKNDKVAMIKIDSEKQNSYYHSIQSLFYEVGKGYSIQGGQKVILADSSKYRVDAVFFK
jgi:hypothetical protein